MATKTQDNILPIDTTTARTPARFDRSLGALLVEEGKLTQEGVDQALALQRTVGLRFGEAALRLGLVSEAEFHQALAKQYGFPCQLVPGEGIAPEVIAATDPYQRAAEEFRALRTHLLTRWFSFENGRRTLTVVSPGKGEGRTYVAANLAVVFAQLGQRTLLIDADLRGPRLHKLFGVADRVGLSAVLAGRAERNVVVPVPGMPTLFLMPAGPLPPNPQELLSRAPLGLLLRQMQAEFDVLIVDTSAAMPYADAQSVAYRAGDALLVARKDRTRVADSNTVLRELREAGARVVGTLVNEF